MADQLIGAGEADIVVAGGMESMTNGPYLLPGARAGYRYGDNKLVDATSHDGLCCAFDLPAWVPPPRSTASAQITREDQDAFAARPTSAPPPPEERSVRRRDRQRDRAAAQGRPDLVSDDEGVRPGTTARAWRSCGRRSPPTARSPPGRRRRSPTVARPSW